MLSSKTSGGKPDRKFANTASAEKKKPQRRSFKTQSLQKLKQKDKQT